jgi:peptidoglycan hydrolase-like protein with peptidoglycan-binding domain
VIADVQAELQEMGYYKGEVDGLLGPLTREALTAYQADQIRGELRIIYR